MEANSVPVLRVKHLTKRFETKENKLTVFENINFSVGPGEVVCLLGPSGCGKSTLLRCLANLTGYEGAISIDGQSPQQATNSKQVGFAFQEAGLINWRSVEDNVLLPSQIGVRTVSTVEAAQRASTLIELMSLRAFKDYFPPMLSGGMRQRTALARALLLTPKLLLLDEPFAALDYLTRLKLMIEFKIILSEQGQSTVLVTHSFEEAAYLADRILVLKSLPSAIIYERVVSYSAPRSENLLSLPEFNEVTNWCREKLFYHEN
jgi:NitT/TauT family transport system ATP-binding protein